MPLRTPSGDPDSYFITRVRRNLRDQPVWFQEPFTTDGTKGAINIAGSSPYRLKRAPVITSGAVCTLNGANQPVAYDAAPATPGVAIVSDTGEFYFAVVPGGNQSILFSYQAARFGDQQILDALTDGMFEMWPEIWLPQVDTSLQFTPSFTEYTLPAVFDDPRVTILSLEVQPPSGILISIPTGKFDVVANQILKMGRGWPAGSTLRITYNSPYTHLADLEQQIEQLPVYYATYKILMDQEAMRSRANDLVQQTGEGGSAPEVASATAQLWLNRFLDAKKHLAVASAVRSLVPDRSVEMLESGMGFSWNPS